MQLIKLELEQFCQFERQTVNFGPGVNGLIGANGAGKSNIFAALKYCLLGTITTAGKQDANIRQQSSKTQKSWAALTFAHGSSHMHIKRYLRPKTTETILTVNGKEFRGDTVANQKILEVLETTSKFVNDVVIVSQGNLFGLVSGTPAQRAETMSRLYGTEAAAKVFTALGQHRGKITIPSVGVNRDEAVREITRLSQWLAETPPIPAADIQKLQQYLAQQQQIGAAYMRKETLQGQAMRLEAEVQSYATQLVTLQQQVDTTSQNVDTLRQAAEGAAMAAADANRLLSILDQARRIEKQLQALQQRHQQQQMQLAQLQDPAVPDGYVPTLAISQQQVQLGAEIQNLRAFVSSFDPAKGLCECPTCHTPTASLEAGLAVSRERLGHLLRIQQQLQQQMQTFDRYERQCQDVRRQRTHIAGLITQLEHDISALSYASPERVDNPDTLQQQIREHSEYVSAYQTYSNQLNQQRVALAQLTGTHSRAVAQLAQVSQEAASIPYTGKDAMTAHEEASRAEYSIRQANIINVDVAKHQSELAGWQRSLDDLNRVEREAATATAWTARLAQMRDIIHSDAAPKIVAQRKLQRLQSNINEHLRGFRAPFQVEAGENLSFVAHFPNGTKTPADRLSFGQRSVLAMSVLMAINFSQANLHFLAMDEPTAHLDEESLNVFAPTVDRLREMAAAQGLQCLIITHANQLERAFDHVVRI